MRAKRPAGILAVAVLLIAVGAVAHASIPAPDGVVHGCYKNSNGDLLVIDHTASCPSGYTAFNWKQSGISGLTTATATGPDVTPGQTAVVRADCGTKFAVAGGWWNFAHGVGPTVLESGPDEDSSDSGLFHKWLVRYQLPASSSDGSNDYVQAWATCVTP